jgi:Ribbon-helix-helix domain
MRIITGVSPRKRPFNITLEQDMIDALRQVERETGVRPAEFIRRAVTAALEQRSEGVRKTERKRASTRKRS